MPKMTGNACVVLVHGLWMNAAALLFLQKRLHDCGYNVVRFGYPTVRAGLKENAAQLSRVLKSLQSETIHIVAHSLGGIVTLHALELNPEPRVRRIVLLGSPVAGSLTGRRLAQFRAGRMLMGASSGLWDERHAVKAPDGVEVGVIAGTLPIGLGYLVGNMPRPHDGAVRVSETRLENSVDMIAIRVSHSAMLFSGNVGRQVCYFLEHARFVHDDAH